jgi:hypothetical protein
VLGITTYTIVPDVIVVYGCSCGGSLYGGSLSPVVIPGGSSHPVTTAEQVVVDVQSGVVVHTSVSMHVMYEYVHVVGRQGKQVDVHVSAGVHISVGKHTVIVEGWHGGGMSHMEHTVVVISSVVVVQLVEQEEMVMMVVTVTVPTT